MLTVLVLRRLLLTLPTLLGVLLAVFVLVRVAPGDPVAMMVGPGASAEDVRTLRALYGFDRSIWAQLLFYLRDVLQGDLGVSISLKQQVGGLVVARLPLTMELAGLATLIAVVLGIAVAVTAVMARGRAAGHAIDALTGVAAAIPDFLWGLIGILTLGVIVPVLPVFGLLDSQVQFSSRTGSVLLESLVRGRFDVAGSALHHLALPALALALPLAAMIARVLRSTLQEVLHQDYILMARVRGLTPLQVVLREALRNALVPALALTGAQFAFLIGGTVLIEKLFGLPGVGSMSIDAVINRDLPLIQGIVLTFGLLFIWVNLAIDLLAAVLNPRLREGH